MYGKIFRHTFERSLMGAGSHVMAVMAYVIASTVKSRVELNPKLLATKIGDTEQRMEEAIEYLCRPDPISTNEEFEGRRLVKEGQFQYFVPSHKIYAEIKDNDDLREANKTRQARWRARKKQMENAPLPLEVNNVHSGNSEQPTSDNITREMAVEWAVQSRALGSDYTEKEAVEAWIYYTGNGWMIGRNRVADYRAALEKRINDKREWSKNDNEKRITVSGKGGGKPHNETGRSIGTLNEGTAALYADGAERPGRTRPRQPTQPPSDPVAGVPPVPDVQRPDAGTGAL